MLRPRLPPLVGPFLPLAGAGPALRPLSAMRPLVGCAPCHAVIKSCPGVSVEEFGATEQCTSPAAWRKLLGTTTRCSSLPLRLQLAWHGAPADADACQLWAGCRAREHSARSLQGLSCSAACKRLRRLQKHVPGLRHRSLTQHHAGQVTAWHCEALNETEQRQARREDPQQLHAGPVHAVSHMAGQTQASRPGRARCSCMMTSVSTSLTPEQTKPTCRSLACLLS